MLKNLLTFTVLLSFSNAQDRTTDSLALVDLYNSTDGANWVNNTNWLNPDSTIDTWFGVTVSTDRVMNIDLPSNNMTGPLPSSFTNLTELFRLTLDHNNLNGNLPSNIGNLTKLTYLHISFNDFIGSIPSSLSTIPTLINIWLNNNSFSGAIPSELGNLLAVESLNLSKNDINGEIPVELGNLTSLKSLQLAHSSLSGSIPLELGNLTSLITLNLANDSLSGSIPPELANITTLKSLYLDRNQLSGSIPKELGSFPVLTLLSLYNNQLIDSIPKELGDLSTLTDLKLSSNNLEASIPQNLENLTALKTLYLQNNSLSGSIPAIFQNLTALKDLRLENNSFSDSLSNNILNATALETLVISGNKFSYIPNLSSLTQLDRLNIESNQLQFNSIENHAALALTNFTYSPQDSVGGTQTIHQFYNSTVDMSVNVDGSNNQYQWYKDGNAISGATLSTFTIPNFSASDEGIYTCDITNTVATDLTLHSRKITLTGETSPRETDSLALVDLYNSTDGSNWTNNTNWLSGNSIDTWFGVDISNGRVSSLNLANDDLTGTIPNSIGDLTALTYLSLGNNLSGAIPSSIGNLINLEEIRLHSNNLSGTIPAELGNLTKLTKLWLYSNELTGSIPTELGDIGTSLTQLYLQYNKLSDSIPASLGNLTSLVYLYLQNNQLSGSIPSEFGALTSLIRCELYNNNLSFVPDLNSLSSLVKLDVRYNQLTFESIESNIDIGLAYSPQDSVGETQSLSQNFGTSLELSVSVGGANNHYQWFRNETSIPLSDSSVYIIPNLAQGDVGEYTCEITNTVATDLTLYSRPITVDGIDGTAPSALTLSGTAGDMQLKLSWTKSRASDFKQYKLFIMQNGNSVLIDSVQTVNDTSYTVSSLTNNLEYEAWILVSDTNDNQSGESNHLFLTTRDLTVPSAVSLQAFAGDSEAQLIWSTNSDTDFKDYLVYQIYNNDTTAIDTIQTQSLIADTIQNLTNYERYHFYLIVRDTNDNRSIPSNLAVAEPQDLTSPNSINLSSATARTGAIDLQWTESDAEDFAHYLIYRESSSTSSIIDTVKTKTSLNYSDENITSSVEYRYAIIVEDIHANKSDTSNFRSATWIEATKAQLSLSVFQNPVTLNYLDIIINSDLDLTNDNLLQINGASVSLTQVQANLLKASYHVDSSGELNIKASVTATNETQSELERNFQVALLTDKSNTAKLNPLTISNLPQASMLLLSELDDHFIVQTNKTPKEALQIDFEIPSEFDDLSKLFISHEKNGEWKDLRTQVFEKQRIARVHTKDLGTFRFHLNYSFEGNNIVPKKFSLEQNYPNPFNPSTQIPYKLAKDGNFQILIFNSLGQVVRTLISDYKLAGSYSTKWDGRNQYGNTVASGIYFYQLRTSSNVISKKMILIK